LDRLKIDKKNGLIQHESGFIITTVVPNPS